MNRINNRGAAMRGYPRRKERLLGGFKVHPGTLITYLPYLIEHAGNQDLLRRLLYRAKGESVTFLVAFPAEEEDQLARRNLLKEKTAEGVVLCDDAAALIRAALIERGTLIHLRNPGEHGSKYRETAAEIIDLYTQRQPTREQRKTHDG